MTDAILPDTFIAGAPKCGTTSLYHWLQTHPEVYMSPFKEPRYFCHDLDFHWRYDDLGDYLGLFGAAETMDGIKRRGESSVWYLYSEVAARNIADLCGVEGTRIIAMVRNPVDMVYSWHSQLVWMGNEQITDFQEAWNAQEDRKAGKRLPQKVNPRQGLYYRKLPLYTEQIQRMHDVFGEERVLTLVFDDLVKDNPGTYEQVCAFLGVDDTYRPDFEHRNPNTTVRSSWFRTVTQDLPSPIQAVTSRLPMGLRLRLREIVKNLNTRVEDREPMDPAFREHLKEEFRPEVARLSKLLDRDLMDWVEPEPVDPPDQADAF